MFTLLLVLCVLFFCIVDHAYIIFVFQLPPQKSKDSWSSANGNGFNWLSLILFRIQYPTLRNLSRKPEMPNNRQLQKFPSPFIQRFNLITTECRLLSWKLRKQRNMIEIGTLRVKLWIQNNLWVLRHTKLYLKVLYLYEKLLYHMGKLPII